MTRSLGTDASTEWSVSSDPRLSGAAQPEVIRALDRALVWFRDRESRPAILARRLLGQLRPSDSETTSFLVRERRRRTRMDGSLDGSLVRTAWLVTELLDLGCARDDAPVVRTLGYVLSQQNRPGHYGEGCEADRHLAERCRHYLRGFFSAGPQDDAIAPLAFPNGIAITDEHHARFAASCFALRVVLRAGEDRRQAVTNHVKSLLGMADLWQSSSPWPLDLQVFALGALAMAPREYRDRLPTCLLAVTGSQAQDGSWPGGELFHVLDVLTSVGVSDASRAIENTIPHLLACQRQDGSFGATATEERTLIAVKAFRRTLRLV